MIELSGIEVVFGENAQTRKIALKNLSMNIREGEFVSVIGGNGAGKSTLLNAIAGEIVPFAGRVSIDDEDVTAHSAQERAAYVARVFQDPAVGTCSALTVAENLALAEKRGRSRGLRRAVGELAKERFAELLRPLNLGLEKRLNTPMGALSGGQRQAASLLMSTLSPLKILLLDEHTAALDPKTGKFIMELTAKIVGEHKLTALMVTHSLTQALRFGSRTVMLREGRIVYDIEGEERAKLTPGDLMRQFGDSLDNDRLLLDS